MLIATIALITIALGQQPGGSPKPEVPVLKAGIGSCSADFTVKEPDGTPAYNATIHVRVRYGVFGVKRADLEVGTNADGLARIEGLPAKAKPLVYDIHKDDRKAGAEQNVADACHATFEVTLR